jgi:hypothetical protein
MRNDNHQGMPESVDMDSVKKKTYNSPALVRFGALATLTQGGGSCSNSDGSTTKACGTAMTHKL